MDLKKAKKIKELDGFTKTVSLYELSCPLMVEGVKGSHLVGGEEIGVDKQQVLFLCDKEGNLLYYIPAIDMRAETIGDALKSEGYILIDDI